ncbi:hypothetical protein QTO34_005580 [Cnephaeus nilssonii]|uniref:Uncharacterized protein n=1 Tax=Cnephaeus nilssonii TaxID=3371016 RepID=A0AA40LK39_CNENI|nr:hypothetical protein QTO34_005580 [Eptesicus nilssonii]
MALLLSLLTALVLFSSGPELLCHLEHDPRGPTAHRTPSQLEDLDTCWAREMGEEGSALATQGPTLALKRYFQGLRLYLKEKKYSDCAWEVVRVEIMRSFSSTRALQERLKIRTET